MPSFLVSFLLALLLAAWPAGAMAGTQAPGKPARWSQLTDTLFEHLGREQGLPHAMARSIAQDADGFIWIGTVVGLIRWDGHVFRAFRHDPADAGSLPADFIQVLHVDGRGRLWVGTGSAGLARYQPESETFIRYPLGEQGLRHASVLALADAPDDALWIGTPQGLHRLTVADGRIEHFGAEAGRAGQLPHPEVNVLLQDRQRQLWLGTPLGLALLPERSNRFQSVPLLDGAGRPVRAVISALHRDSAGNLWVGTRNAGLGRLDAGSGQVRLLDGPQAALWRAMGINTIQQVAPGRLWLGTGGGGVVDYQVADGAGRLIQRDRLVPGSLSDDYVRDMLLDRDGHIWVGTDNGLDRHDPSGSPIRLIWGGSSRPGGLSDTDVTAILQDARGMVWLGLGNRGIEIFDPHGQRLTALRPDPQRLEHALPGRRVWFLAQDPQGNVWIATDMGLYRSDGQGRAVRRVRLPGDDPYPVIWRLLASGDSLWLGTASAGLWRYRPATGQLQVWRQGAAAQGGLSDDRVIALHEGPDQQLWVGTRRGLNRLDMRSGAVVQMLADGKDPQSLSSDRITSLERDRHGRLWVGSLNGYPVWLDPSRSADRPRFERPAGPRSTALHGCTGLLADEQGRLWASCGGGFAVIDPQQASFRSLSVADGAPVADHWYGARVATREGELLFGTDRGLSIVLPALLRPLKPLPPVVVTRLKLGSDWKPAAGLVKDAPLRWDPLESTCRHASLSIL